MVYNLARVFRKVDACLASNPYIHLDALARELRIGRRTIERAVLQSTGITFRDYRRKVLVEQAIRLLVQRQDLLVKEIAARIGYRSAKAFWRW